MSAPADVLVVLNRAAGDATGNPVEAGQAYAAIEAFKELVGEHEALSAALSIADDGLSAARDLIALQSAELTSLRARVQGGAA